MKNREIEAAWDYHNGTKHSYESIRANRHFLDWENQPIAFKIYSDLEPIPLPEHLSSSGIAGADGHFGVAVRRPINRLFQPCKRWRKFFFFRPALPDGGNIPAERFFSAPRRVRARSITSISIVVCGDSKD